MNPLNRSQPGVVCKIIPYNLILIVLCEYYSNSVVYKVWNVWIIRGFMYLACRALTFFSCFCVVILNNPYNSTEPALL